MNLIGAELKKIVSKKYVWIIALLLALFYAYLILNLASNFNVITQRMLFSLYLMK